MTGMLLAPSVIDSEHSPKTWQSGDVDLGQVCVHPDFSPLCRPADTVMCQVHPLPQKKEIPNDFNFPLGHMDVCSCSWILKFNCHSLMLMMDPTIKQTAPCSHMHCCLLIICIIHMLTPTQNQAATATNANSSSFKASSHGFSQVRHCVIVFRPESSKNSWLLLPTGTWVLLFSSYWNSRRYGKSLINTKIWRAPLTSTSVMQNRGDLFTS